MRKLLRALAILGSLAVAAVSQAAVGTVNITWDNCSGPVDKTTTATGVYSLFLTVIGRLPSGDERDLFTPKDDFGFEDVFWALVNSADFVFVS